MTSQLNRLRINVENYYKMAEVGIIKPTDNVELIEGEIITMSPSKSPHAGIINLLNKLLITQSGDKATITVQNPLRIDQFSEPEPDFIIAKFRKDAYSKKHPTPKDCHLVIEVADSSLAYDRKIKLPLYAKAGIPEYWIVNIEKKQIEQYFTPGTEKYLKKKIIRKGKISCTAIDFSLNLADIFL